MREGEEEEVAGLMAAALAASGELRDAQEAQGKSREIAAAEATSGEEAVREEGSAGRWRDGIRDGGRVPSRRW